MNKFLVKAFTRDNKTILVSPEYDLKNAEFFAKQLSKCRIMNCGYIAVLIRQITPFIRFIERIQNMSNSPRPLSQIAKEISADWKNINYAAKPYLDAMKQLGGMNDKFYNDSAKSIVLYFLGNASSWRGPVARRIKLELNEMVKVTQGV